MLHDLNLKIEHTCLKPSASEADIRKLCHEALEYQFYGVCVAGSHLALVRKELSRSSIRIVSVVGFPHGNTHPKAKRDEMLTLIDEGAHEIDIVINWGALKEKREGYISEELNLLSQAAGSVPLKLIIEASELTDAEKKLACELAQRANFAFVKTSTGFASGGASASDIRLMRETIGPLMGIKASGGIKNFIQANEMILAGANRIGASASVSLIQEWKKEMDTSK